ncbi:MAG: DUF3276 family protein [Bacteroidales bacterium]|jgi:hypothetical protein|nr:DUF3276 family protein [Bacteroidales bacterium]
MDSIEKDRRIVNSTSVKIGKRTYFFDVKATANGDYYLVMTESRRIQDGSFEKHKIFLYKEDFYKFTQAYDEVMSFMKGEKPDYFVEPEFPEVEEEQ